MLRLPINRVRWAVATVVVLLAALSLSVVTAAPAAAGPKSFYWIVNVNSGKCLNVDNASLADRARLIQWTCQTSGPPNDQWFTWSPDATPRLWITNRNSEKCANVDRASTLDRAPVIQWTCQTTVLNDRWLLQDLGNGIYWIVNVNSGKCLNVDNASLADRAPVIQWPCQTSFLNDHWTLVYRDSGP